MIHAPTARAQNWLLQSKNVDLLLLAGCSCLLTLLYHPVAEAVVSPHLITSPALIASVVSSNQCYLPLLEEPRN